MEDKLKINLLIGERSYPLNIDRNSPHLEELYRKAVAEINANLLKYKQRGYKGKDNQDFLAMTALTYVSRLMSKEESEDASLLINELKNINFKLEEFIESEKEKGSLK